jgi:hypothetical protein
MHALAAAEDTVKEAALPLLSLTRISSAPTPSTAAIAARPSAPCRTSDFGEPCAVRPYPPDRSFSPPFDISYRAVKLPRVSAAFGRYYLRREADFPQVPVRRLWELLDMALSLGTEG